MTAAAHQQQAHSYAAQQGHHQTSGGYGSVPVNFGSALLPSASLPGTPSLPGFAPSLGQPASQSGESQNLRDQTNHLKSLLGL